MPGSSDATPSGSTKPEIVRAAVESVAENTVDGVIGAAALRRAVRSGRRDRLQGDQHARLDVRVQGRAVRRVRLGVRTGWTDRGQLMPARLTRPADRVRRPSLLGHATRGGPPHQLARDGRQHASPNAGLPEAAMAGALGCSWAGGTARGRADRQAYMGDPLDRLNGGTSRPRTRLMFGTTTGRGSCGLASRGVPACWTLACGEGTGMNDAPWVLLFTGDGKGKTTAALGLASSRRPRDATLVVQFVKAGRRDGRDGGPRRRHRAISRSSRRAGVLPPDRRARVLPSIAAPAAEAGLGARPRRSWLGPTRRGRASTKCASPWRGGCLPTRTAASAVEIGPAPTVSSC